MGSPEPSTALRNESFSASQRLCARTIYVGEASASVPPQRLGFFRHGSHIRAGGNWAGWVCAKTSFVGADLFGFCLGFCGGAADRKRTVGQESRTTERHRVSRMTAHRIGRIEPACKFGPGGEYLSVWPVSPPPCVDPSAGHLTRVLASVAEIVGVLSGTRRTSSVIAPSDQPVSGCQEKTTDAAERDRHHRRFDPQAASGAPAHRRFPRQSLLFPDDSRVSGETESESKHRVRAPKRAAKKIVAHNFPGQGSLFEIDVPRTKTA